MKYLKLELQSKNILVKEDTSIEIKYVGEIKDSIKVSIIPKREGTSINISLLVLLKGNSDLKIEVGVVNKYNIKSYSYSLTGKIILTNTSKAYIVPKLSMNSIDILENHSISIGGIDELTKQYLESKGYNPESIIKLFEKNINS